MVISEGDNVAGVAFKGVGAFGLGEASGEIGGSVGHSGSKYGELLNLCQ